MSSKINILNIIKDHISTLKDFDNDTYSITDLSIFFILPFITSLIIIYLNMILSNELVNVLVMSLSVFAGLLFNLLVLVYDIMSKPNSSNKLLKGTLLKQLYSNISFGILISVLTVFLLIVFSLMTNSQIGATDKTIMISIQPLININAVSQAINQEIPIINYIVAFFIYYLVLIFIMTLFMILKRFHIIFRKEFVENDNSS